MSAPSCLEPFRGYIEARFVDDPHLDATVLFRELVDAGFDRSHDRDRGHRPADGRRGAGRQALRRRGRGLPPTRGQRKGVVEAAVKYSTKSWWRSAPVTTMAEAQALLDAWCIDVADRRARPDSGTVGQIGRSAPLRALPAAAYPAVIRVERKASRSAVAAFEANHYSVPPAHAARTHDRPRAAAQRGRRTASSH
jgi:hypothetical protein